MYCGKCGKQTSQGIRYCVHCGADMAQQTPLPPSSTPAAETIEDTDAMRQDLLDASKPTGETPRGPKMISADAVGLGKTLAGRYTITDRLGVGGMGEVFKASDKELNDLAVAIKVLPPILAANTRSINRLRTEAAISLKLTHPNVCRLHTFRVDGDVKFLVMEHIAGRTLEEMLDATDERKLPLAEILPIARNVADALDFAHSQNPPILHRDIKPSNVMVGPQGVGKVLDFGIARELKDSMTRMTGKDTSGTLLYMSPEQFTGSTPTAASDVYSFAAMLYECLCGHAPFWQGAIAHQLLNQTPVRIPGMPDHVNDALQAGLAKNSTDRPSNARELVRMLAGRDVGALESSGGALSSGQPARAAAQRQPAAEAPAERHKPKARAPKGKTRSRGPAHVIFMLLLALVGVAGVGYWQGWWPPEILTKLGLGPAKKPARGGAGPTGRTRPATRQAVGLDAAIAAQQQADDSWAKVKDVAGENHFDLKLKAVQAQLSTGRDQITKTQYAQAVATYNNVVKRCGEIAALDEDRQRAVAGRIEADKARSAAEGAGAARLAAALWQVAESKFKSAGRLLEADKFAQAVAAWGEAQQEYGKAAVLAGFAAKVETARKVWDEALATADMAVLKQYGGDLWVQAQAAQGQAIAAGIAEQAVTKWPAAAKLLTQAWQHATAEQAKAQTVAGHIEAAETLLKAGKYPEARKAADMALAVIPGHEAATFLAAKADAGAVLAQAKAAMEARPVEALACVRMLLPKLEGLATRMPADADIKAWLAEVAGFQQRLAGMYRLERRLSGHEKAVTSMAFGAAGAELVSTGAEGKVLIRDLASGKILRRIDTGGEAVSVACSPDGTQLAWGVGAKLVITARTEGTKAVAYEGHVLAVLAVAFSPSGKTVVTCGEDDKLIVRDVAGGKIIATLENKDDVTCLAFSPDGILLVSGTGKLLVGKDDKLVKVWNVADAKCLHELGGHKKTVRAVAFSDDGKLVASADDEGTILVCEAAGGKEVTRLAGHKGAVSSLAFGKGASALVSGGADMKVRLWDVASGKCTQVLDGHTAPVRAVQFSRDGQRLISAGEDKTIVIWALGLRPADKAPVAKDPAAADRT